MKLWHIHILVSSCCGWPFHFQKQQKLMERSLAESNLNRAYSSGHLSILVPLCHGNRRLPSVSLPSKTLTFQGLLVWYQQPMLSLFLEMFYNPRLAINNGVEYSKLNTDVVTRQEKKLTENCCNHKKLEE